MQKGVNLTQRSIDSMRNHIDRQVDLVMVVCTTQAANYMSHGFQTHLAACLCTGKLLDVHVCSYVAMDSLHAYWQCQLHYPFTYGSGQQLYMRRGSSTCICGGIAAASSSSSRRGSSAAPSMGQYHSLCHDRH